MSKGYVYVLKCRDGRLYTGSTRDVTERLKDHHAGRVRTTKDRRPVRLIHTEEYDDYSTARRRESFLKSGAGREWLDEQWRGGRAV